MSRTRIGIDFGGTKVEIAALDAGGQELVRRRIPSPAAGGAAEYERGVRDVADLVRGVEATLGETASIGVGIPGVISPATGLVKNANSICLNGHAFDRDLAAALGRPVRVENDANCFALSEALDGAGRGHRMVFGVILGTGVGGGIVRRRPDLAGPQPRRRRMGPQPPALARAAELPGPLLVRPARAAWRPGSAGPALAARLRRAGPSRRERHPGPRRGRRGSAPRRRWSGTRPARARPRHHHQRARPRRDRARRRPLQHGRISTRAFRR